MTADNAAKPAAADPVNGIQDDLAAHSARSHAQPAVGSHRERDHDYGAIVAELDDKTRVIECVDGLQWILQRLRGDRWFAIAYCRTRDPLIREATKALGGAAPEALFALPPRLGRTRGRRGSVSRLRGAAGQA
jgi:hypothetical protein